MCEIIGWRAMPAIVLMVSGALRRCTDTRIENSESKKIDLQHPQKTENQSLLFANYFQKAEI